MAPPARPAGFARAGIGLAPPAAVTAATADYLAEEDTFGAWLAEWVHAAPSNASVAGPMSQACMASKPNQWMRSGRPGAGT